MTNYEIISLIINAFIAIGTCGAVVFAILNSMPVKEVANGKVYFGHSINPRTKEEIISDVVFSIESKCKKSIVFNYNAGIVLFSKNDSETIILNNTANNCCFIAPYTKQQFKYNLNIVNDRVEKLLNENCEVLIYTMRGNPIQLECIKE